jgi:tetratricopeptide (TPR) repeat protein
MNTYSYDGFGNGDVYRDDNATGVFIGVGINGVRLFDELIRVGDTTRALDIANKMMDNYPEYWQIYTIVAGMYDQMGDSTKAEESLIRLRDVLIDNRKTNPENLFYQQDLGLVKVLLGQRKNDQAKIDEGLTILWKAFEANANSSYGFRKLITVLSQLERYSEMNEAAKKFAEYKINLRDPLVQRLLGIVPQEGVGQ